MRVRRSLAAMLLVSFVAACTGGDDGQEADNFTPADETPTTAAGIRVTDETGAALEARYDLAAPGSIRVGLEAPDGATQVQLSVDGSFGGAEWQPIQPEVDLPVLDTGYVQVFARFRAGPSADPSAPLVTGLLVDPGWGAATSASAETGHQPTLVGLAAPDVLVVRVETGRVVRGGQESYPFGSPPDGDTISTGDGGVSVVTRNGQLYGTQVAPGLDVINRPDRLAGYPLDTARVENAAAITIASSDDAGFGSGASPTSVTRVTRPFGSANIIENDPSNAAVHDFYLQLPSQPTPGATYTVTFPDDVVQPATFTFDPTSSRSVAVHANQVGFRPGDALKVAYASAWDGGRIDLPASLAFSVIDTDSGDAVFEGTSTPRSTGSNGERGRGDLTGTSVQELDFSGVTDAGTYRVCVDVLGCSADFAISEESTWRRAAVSIARSLYHQRSGQELGAPYTSVERPRGFHPDDGIEVQQATVSEVEIAEEFSNGEDGFETLAAAGTSEIVPDAWGGHFDAGDWDRRISHLAYLRAALDLVDLYPETWADLDLDIPESGDAIPDILDEGLWDLDLYRRLQTPEGGIRGGIESDEHPLPRETSWTQTQQVFVYAPDARSSYAYAGVAAETARVLGTYDATRAAEYQQSALAAMTWAEQNPSEADGAEDIDEARAAAAAALFRLTGDVQWQDVFLEASPFDEGPLDVIGCEPLRQCDAAWIYAQTTQPGMREDVKANVVESFRRNAASILASQETTLFGWTMEHPSIPLVWGLGPSTPKTLGLLRAYSLTGDTELCQATLRTASFSLGANPLDTVFVTGLGAQNVRNPLIVDAIYGGIPVWPGTPVFGLHELDDGEEWVAQFRLRPSGASPDPDGVPFLQSYWDISGVPMMSEFTVHQSHAFALYAYGSLAGLTC